MNRASILIINNEAQIRKILSIALQSIGHKILEVETGKEGLSFAASHRPDLILLDLELPDVSGHEVLKHLRDWYCNPIIITSAQNNEENIVKALDHGADDYLVKPFRTVELLARIKTALKKVSTEPTLQPGVPQVLTIDFATRVITKNGLPVKLTDIEYSVLALLIKNEENVLTHHYLLTHVHDALLATESHYLRVLIAQIRKKIEPDPNHPVHIITEPGIGYRFIGNKTIKTEEHFK